MCRSGNIELTIPKAVSGKVSTSFSKDALKSLYESMNRRYSYTLIGWFRLFIMVSTCN